MAFFSFRKYESAKRSFLSESKITPYYLGDYKLSASLPKGTYIMNQSYSSQSDPPEYKEVHLERLKTMPSIQNIIKIKSDTKDQSFLIFDKF